MAHSSLGGEISPVAVPPQPLPRLPAASGSAVLRATSRVHRTCGSSAARACGGGAPRPRLDLWPTPGADKVDGLTAYFRAGWRSIRGDKDTISVPAFMEPLYIQMVRTFALGYERDSEADISRRLSGLRNSTMFKDCRTRDSLLRPSYGPSINGAAAGELTGASAMWNFGDIGGPG